MGKQLSTRAAIIFGALAVLGPTFALAAEPPPAPGLANHNAVALAVDTGVLDSDLSERLEDQLHQQLDPILGQAGLELVGPNNIASRTLQVRVLSFDSDRRDYQLELRMRGPDNAVSLPPIPCDACSEARLVGVVSDSAERLIALYDEAQPQPQPQRLPERATPEPVVDHPSLDPPLARRLGPVGFTGAALLGGGVAAGAVGGYLWYRGVEPVGSATARFLESRDFRTPGVATLAIGAVATTVGAALLIVDLRRRRAARRVLVEVTPAFGGLGLRGQF